MRRKGAAERSGGTAAGGGPGETSAHRPVVATALRRTFPDCPREFVEAFVALLEAPRQELAAQAILVLQKPYGRNHVLVRDGAFGLSFAVLEPGRSTSLHFHRRRREFFCVRSGRITLTSGEEVIPLGRFACGTSTVGVAHRLANPATAPAEVLEVFSPALLDDKHRVEDRYGRAVGDVGVFE